jgi:hypothetical protein
MSGAQRVTVKKGNKKLARLLAEDSDDDEMSPASNSIPSNVSEAAEKPWLHEFKAYLDGVDEVPNGMTITKWWGVCNHILAVQFIG